MKKIFKIALAVMLVLVVVLIAAFSYISSGHFIQSQVLPRVSRALGIEVVAADVEFAVLSRLELKNLRMGSETDPLLRADMIRVQYRALSMLSSKIEINEILLDGVTLAVTPEKLAELQPAPEAGQEPEPEKPARPSEPKSPPELLIQNVGIRNLSLSYTADDSAGRTDVEVKGFNLELPILASGSEFKLTARARSRVNLGNTLDAELNTITMDLEGALNENLLPNNLRLDLNLSDIAGQAGPVALKGRRLELSGELAGSAEQYELSRLGLTEYHNDIKDAELAVNGTVGLEPLTASLDIAASIPPGSLLDLAGAFAGGLEFGRTAIAYTGHVDMPSPRKIASQGDLAVSDFSVAAPAAKVPALPPMQVTAAHDLSINLDAGTVAVDRLDMKVEERGREVVGLKLEQPVSLNMRDPGGDASSRFAVKVDRFDLTLLNAFLVNRSDLRILSGELNRVVNINITNGGRQLAVDVGGGGIDRLRVQQGNRRIGPLRINHEARLRLTDFQSLSLDHFKVELIPLAAGPQPAATLTLQGQLELKPELEGRVAAGIEGDGGRVLALMQPLMPPGEGVQRLAGSFNLNSQVLFSGPSQVIQLEAAGGAKGLDFALDDGTALAAPVSTDLNLKLDGTVGGEVRLEQLGLQLSRSGLPEPLLDMQAVARFDTGMQPNVKNTVNISANGPLRLDELERLLIKPETPEAQGPAEPLPPPAEDVAEPPPALWIEVGLEVGQATYRAMKVADLEVNTVYRNGLLDINRAHAVVNGGAVDVSGSVDLARPAKPVYDLTVKSGGLPFEPVFASFVPGLPLKTSGGLKRADIQLKGEGFDLPSMQENLTATADIQLDQLIVEQMYGTFGRLTEALLLSIFDLGMNDLVFVDGGLILGIDRERYGDGDIHIEQLLMRAPLFMLDGAGSVEFGGEWEPDVEIKTGFSDGKTASLRSRGFAIASEKDLSGYHAGPTIPLQGDLLNLRNQARIVTAVLVDAGKISAEDALKADLANGVLGVLSGDGDLGSLFEGEDAAEKIGTLLEGVMGVEKKQGRDDDAGDPAEAIGNVLQGLFGN